MLSQAPGTNSRSIASRPGVPCLDQPGSELRKFWPRRERSRKVAPRHRVGLERNVTQSGVSLPLGPPLANGFEEIEPRAEAEFRDRAVQSATPTLSYAGPADEDMAGFRQPSVAGVIGIVKEPGTRDIAIQPFQFV